LIISMPARKRPNHSSSPKSSRSGARKGKPRSRKGRSGGGFFARVRRAFFTLVLFGILAAAGGAAYLYHRASQFDLSQVKELPERTLVYDRGGILMGHVAGHGENRVSVPASKVSPYFVKALLAREDTRFYDHYGIDPVGVLRALVTNLRAGGTEQGASTITMQLARNTFGMKERSYQRKLLEAALAIRLEREFSKEELLTCYMNRVYFGSGLHGIERASQGYFMKSASDLTLAESAILAGVVRGPSLLNPFRSMENAKDIQAEVLDRLVASDLVTRAEADAAKAQPIALRPADQRLATGSYPLQTVFDLLEDYLARHHIERGGLRIHTTFDSALQKTAEAALDRHLAAAEARPGYSHPKRASHSPGGSTKYLQGALVSLDNRTGGIVALVGGRNFRESSFNRAFFAHRQVGSTFKPFVYAAAFGRGLLPGAYVSDDPVRFADWSPRNSDGTYTGLQPAALGLIRSRNTMSVRVGQIAGVESVRKLARDLKLGELPASPVISLGTFESSPLNLTSAYSTLAAGGVNLAPHLITRIEHSDGTVLFDFAPAGRRVLSEGVAWVTSDILGKVMDEGTATKAREDGYRAPAYGKTGTTNDYKDAWFVGYTDKLTTGVWVGLDQPKTIMERGYGGTLALPVWTEVMKAAEERGFAAAPLAPPRGSRPVALCRECGLQNSNRTRHPYQMDLPPDMQPRASCRGHGGLFAGKGAVPQAHPIPGETALVATPVGGGGPVAANAPNEKGGVGKAMQGLGRKLFGERR
jgi:penicillin-binding protein 1A